MRVRARVRVRVRMRVRAFVCEREYIDESKGMLSRFSDWLCVCVCVCMCELVEESAQAS